MSCNHDLDQLILLQADELSEGEAAALRIQMDSCDACREELARLEHLAGMSTTPELDPEAVAAARAVAYARIGASWRIRRQAVAGRLSGLLQRMRPLPELALGMLLVAVGYGIGASGGSGSDDRVVVETVVEEVRDIRVDEELGEAIVRYDRPEPRALTGNLGNEAIAQVLQAALLAGDDNGIRNQALKTVRALARSGTPESDLSKAIIELVRAEQQDALRLRAIWALDALYESAVLPDEARGALLEALTSDAGDGVRIAALNSLMAHEPLAQDAGRLREVMSSDSNPYVRSGAARTLERIGVPLEQLDGAAQ